MLKPAWTGMVRSYPNVARLESDVFLLETKLNFGRAHYKTSPRVPLSILSKNKDKKGAGTLIISSTITRSHLTSLSCHVEPHGKGH